MARARSAKRRTFGKLRQLPSGRYQASYPDPRGSGRYYTAPHTYDAKIDAEGWLAAESRLIQLGEWTPPAERSETKAASLVMFGEYAEQWLVERDLTPKTRSLYRGLLDSRILPTMRDEYLSDLSPALIRTWWAGLGSEYPTRSAHAYQLLRSVLNTAVDDHLIVENPCKIKGAGQAPKRRDHEILTPAELDDVYAAMPKSYRAAVLVAAWAGLRFGELIELRRKNVVRDNGVVSLRIRRAATLVDGQIVVGNTKTEAGARDVVLPPHIAKILEAHITEYVGPGPESLLFRTTRGKRLSQSAFTKTFKAALPAGKKNVRVHDLRHTGAVLAAQAGATVKELMGRLGHTTPNVAMHYQHVAAGRDASVAAAMSALVAKPDDVS
ncbi:tyrosine-type recombinase/integrase [Gordonia sp. (in: high G+C Gram-positive bacteria)]|uniref:tyrosine-type recombinase/integrase n=1 Tax=Gordonia sp. (in: high G+C Gram-positive bacteria) TaxID=84139 RepID=UPI0033412665